MMMSQNKSVSNPSRAVALAEQPCVYWMIGWEELNGVVQIVPVKTSVLFGVASFVAQQQQYDFHFENCFMLIP